MTFCLNPTFETFFLLGYTRGKKEQKKEIIKQLDGFGINGTAFYAANYPLVERYADAFASQMVKTDGVIVFEDMCDELAILLLDILLLHPEWLAGFGAVSDKEALAVVRDRIADFLESDEEAIVALEASELSDQAKWQVAALLQQAKQKISLIIEAVNANLAAFEYAYTAIEAEVAPLITQLEDQLKKGELPPVIQKTAAINPTAQIIPSMAASLAVMVFDEHYVIGLLLNKIFSGRNEGLTETEAVLVAKALSDASRLEILRALKNDKLYNLEIAHKLELTPATASHHMSMLLSAGLVEVSKEGSKVYYCLCTEGIKRYCNWLKDTLI